VVLRLVAFGGDGNHVGTLEVTPNPDFQNVLIPLSGPARRLEARVVGSKSGTGGGAVNFTAAEMNHQAGVLAVDRAGYIGLRDYLDYLVGPEACDPTSDAFQNAYSGRGALSFLPNHEYEVAVSTRVTVAHPSRAAESVEVKEYVYFKTKGLPGLNAVGAVGDEVAPYVRSVYDGGRGTLYCEEPVAVAFAEDFHVAVPLPLRPSGTSEERNTLLLMKLLVRPDVARDLETPFTTTAVDWVVAHRQVIFLDPKFTYKGQVSEATTKGTAMVTTDPFRRRLAVVTQRPNARCPLPDPRQVVGTALVASPQGEPDPLDPAKQLWPASRAFTAAVRPDGAGFVDRPEFVAADLTAFDLALDASAGGGSAWSVTNGAVGTSAGSQRLFAIFGEPAWNHVTVEVSITQLGTLAGVGVALPAGGVPSRGLFAVVQRSGGGRRIAIFRRLSGTQFDELAQAALPAAADPAAPIPLTVTAFDDKLRAAVRDTVVEVEREELREGRLCLLAQDVCRFGTLRVTGLDIYRFPFRTSRYRSFTDHVGSFQAPLDVIAANALGPGTTTATTAGLYAATSGAIAAAMQPAAEAGQRQALFERWTRELGLPLRDEVNQLELSRFPGGTQVELFLLESPEPLDFTEEIQTELAWRDLVLKLPGGALPRHGKSDKIAKRRALARDDLARSLGLAAPGRPGGGGFRAGAARPEGRPRHFPAQIQVDAAGGDRATGRSRPAGADPPSQRRRHLGACSGHVPAEVHAGAVAVADHGRSRRPEPLPAVGYPAIHHLRGSCLRYNNAWSSPSLPSYSNSCPLAKR
jgi:hypothetical protein